MSAPRRSVPLTLTLALGAMAAMFLPAACAYSSPVDDKRAELAPAPFVMGSRYGRSPPRLLTPRNDKFFMGSRYGKRSEEPPLAQVIGQGPRSLEGPPTSQGPLPSQGPQGRSLLCQYTGVSALFSCRFASRDEYRKMDEDPLSYSGED